MKTVATNKKLREVLKGIENNTLIARPDFQRRLVWTNKDKISFIKTVLDGYPFPEIYYAAGEVNSDTGDAIEYLVDGQQRITTLYDYFKGNENLKLDSTIQPYKNLEPDVKTDFLQYDVVVRDLGNLPLDEIKEIFRKINATSYSLNAMEIHNSRYNGELKQLADEIARLEIFNNVFNLTDIRRMNDLKYVLILIVTMLSTYFDRDKEIENYLDKYNNEFHKKEEIKRRLETIFNFISSCNFDLRSRVWNKADFFTIVIELDILLRNGKLEGIKGELMDFYNYFDNNKPETYSSSYLDYYNSALQGSQSRSSRITRGSILRNSLEKN
ncbi:MAG: DUF262 domain-containing protein [Sulfurimonas sp.]|nr:DUF262 domain-containing protein [Sulfurimonas sp.]